MTSALKDKKLWIGIVLLVILFSLVCWMYQEYVYNYQRLEASNEITSSLLNQQSQLTRRYSKELVTVKEALRQNEELVKQSEERVKQSEEQLTALAAENTALKQNAQEVEKENIQRIAQLKTNIDDLKAKNGRLQDIANALEKEVAPFRTENIQSVKDGKNVVALWRKKLDKIKQRITKLKEDAYVQKINEQEELDKVRSLVGNNGFLTRNGQPAVREIILPSGNKNIKVDVQFVK